MHRRTQQRLSERVARLEEAITQPTGDEIVLDALQRAAAEGVLGDEYAAAWREYLRRCEEIEARGDRPPDYYERGRPEAERAFWWRAWHHPDLNPPIDVMLRLLQAWIRRLQADSQPTESDPA